MSCEPFSSCMGGDRGQCTQPIDSRVLPTIHILWVWNHYCGFPIPEPECTASRNYRPESAETPEMKA